MSDQQPPQAIQQSAPTQPQAEPKPAALQPAPAPKPETPVLAKVNGYTIESGVKIPPLKIPMRKSEFGEVVEAMKVGDSFVALQAKRGRIGTAAKKAGVKISSRKLEDGKSVRVWRVA